MIFSDATGHVLNGAFEDTDRGDFELCSLFSS